MSLAIPINRLLEDLPAKERNRILERCETVNLVFGQILSESGRPFRYVYFPLSAFISLVEKIDLHPPLEIGLIGNEGMMGANLALGVRNSSMRAVVQGPGSALRISVPTFLIILHGNPGLMRTLNRYLYVMLAQLSRSVVCIRFHEVEARLARWLLMTHDRAHADHFYLTHQYLADMLGVQRSAVTIAAGSMQKKKLIRYVRGNIRILDRSGLEAASCECYDALNKEYAALFA